MNQLASISILVFGVLVSLGGFFGFLKAKSKVSLIMGLISGALLLTSYSVSRRNPEAGFLFASIVVGFLLVVFSIRFFKTKKFMPSGMLLLLSVIEALILLLNKLSA